MNSRTAYTRELLSDAALRCNNIAEVIAFLGTSPYSKLDRYLMKRFAHFGIDVSHFSTRRRQPRPSTEELRHAVSSSISLAEALRLLGRRDNGGQRALLRRWITEEGISTDHFLGQAHQRGKPGPTARLHADEILVKREQKGRTRTAILRRALLDIGVPERCARCGTGPVWRGKPMTLEVDHINGVPGDDRRENLRLLCPNCHAITGTWCRGGARRPTHNGPPSRAPDPSR
ncbi:HNH endonuclease [Streptomyces sp. V1I6]|uniref:HNH endonuclease n=1 Tax=Streptomyces sp. V1I6 TaxID=3042273 RepID=UPI00277F05AD|nr:HNH endonuclease signature motif containing protein [Streptomyces sp. V1I6]MDQ0843036.1 hypothetical protein [Streptomyces sp. V1I6]